MIPSAPINSRNKINGAKAATLSTQSASRSAPTAVANEGDLPRPDNIADPVAKASAMTIFELISASAPSI